MASVGASFAPQRGLRCCTKPQAVLGFCSFLSGFYLQIEGKRKWTRGDSNPWPPPCEGGALPTELRAREGSAILTAGSRIARQETRGVLGVQRRDLSAGMAATYTIVLAPELISQANSGTAKGRQRLS